MSLGNPTEKTSNGVTLFYVHDGRLVGMVYETKPGTWLTRRVVAGTSGWDWLEKSFPSEGEALAFAREQIVKNVCWFSG